MISLDFLLLTFITGHASTRDMSIRSARARVTPVSGGEALSRCVHLAVICTDYKKQQHKHVPSSILSHSHSKGRFANAELNQDQRHAISQRLDVSLTLFSY